jgi:hypothetical protein
MFRGVDGEYLEKFDLKKLIAAPSMAITWVQF